MAFKNYLLGFFAALICLSSCSSSQIQITYSKDKPYSDSSFDFSMSTYIKTDTIDFGLSRIFEKVFSYRGSHGDSLNLRMWFPGGQHVDSTKIILLVPGFHDEVYELYPLAIEATKRGIITAMLSPRSIELNENIADDYGINELQDAEDALNSYQKDNKLQTLKVAVFGCSLGSVVALNLGVRDSRVRGAVCESIMSDPIVTSKKLLSGKESQQLQTLLSASNVHVADYSPETVIRKFPPDKKLFVIWGEKDKLISSDEQTQLKALIIQNVPSATTMQVPGIGHVLRYGFPLPQQEALKLNGRIISFLEGLL